MNSRREQKMKINHWVQDEGSQHRFNHAFHVMLTVTVQRWRTYGTRENPGLNVSHAIVCYFNTRSTAVPNEHLTSQSEPHQWDPHQRPPSVGLHQSTSSVDLISRPPSVGPHQWNLHQPASISRPPSVRPHQLAPISRPPSVDPRQSSPISRPPSVVGPACISETPISRPPSVDPRQSASISRPLSVRPHQSTPISRPHQ